MTHQNDMSAHAAREFLDSQEITELRYQGDPKKVRAHAETFAKAYHALLLDENADADTLLFAEHMASRSRSSVRALMNRELNLENGMAA